MVGFGPKSNFIGSGLAELPILVGGDGNFGPSGLCALPLAVGINEGGNYFRSFSFSSSRPWYSKPQKGF